MSAYRMVTKVGEHFLLAVLICSILISAGCAKPPELRGIWRSQNGHWLMFTNSKSVDITMGTTYTDAEYRFSSATEIAFGFSGFGGVKWEACTFKLINQRSFFLSDCANDGRDGIYRYVRPRR